MLRRLVITICNGEDIQSLTSHIFKVWALYSLMKILNIFVPNCEKSWIDLLLKDLQTLDIFKYVSICFFIWLVKQQRQTQCVVAEPLQSIRNYVEFTYRQPPCMCFISNFHFQMCFTKFLLLYFQKIDYYYMKNFFVNPQKNSYLYPKKFTHV